MLHGDQVVELSVLLEVHEKKRERMEKDRSKLRMREVNSRRNAHG